MRFYYGNKQKNVKRALHVHLPVNALQFRRPYNLPCLYHGLYLFHVYCT